MRVRVTLCAECKWTWTLVHRCWMCRPIKEDRIMLVSSTRMFVGAGTDVRLR